MNAVLLLFFLYTLRLSWIAIPTVFFFFIYNAKTVTGIQDALIYSIQCVIEYV